MKLVLVYLTSVILANLIVTAFGPSASVPTAFVLIALDLTARDSLHDAWHDHHLKRKMAALIFTGSALSALINIQALPIAIASFAAFALSESADTVVYMLLGNRSRAIKVNGSNVVSAAVDSLAFPILAFGLPVLWGIVIGQFAAKTVGGYLWSLVLRPKAEVAPVNG